MLEEKFFMTAAALNAWHDIVESGDVGALDDLLAEDAVFHSPVVHTPQAGKALVKAYLTAASQVLGGEGFQYLREVSSDNLAVLEFQTEIDGIVINGVDMIAWNADGKIVDFKVMVRPLKAINLLHAKMAEMLQAMRGGS
jgi:ketosteroid isomerase-like protein